MAFSYTGLAYLFIFLIFGFLVYRFFQYWQHEKTLVSKLFFYFGATMSLFLLFGAIGGLFFAKNINVLKGVVIAAAFSQAIACAIMGYLILYLKFPKISPWFGFAIVFLLGMAATVLTITTPFEPFLEPSRTINWGFQPLADTLRSSVFLITLLPLGIILIQQFRTSKNPLVRARALGLGSVCLVGLIFTFVDFFFEHLLKLSPMSGEIAMILLGLPLLIFVLLTQKPPPPEKEYVSPPPTPKIPW